MINTHLLTMDAFFLLLTQFISYLRALCDPYLPALQGAQSQQAMIDITNDLVGEMDVKGTVLVTKNPESWSRR